MVNRLLPVSTQDLTPGFKQQKRKRRHRIPDPIVMHHGDCFTGGDGENPDIFAFICHTMQTTQSREISTTGIHGDRFGTAAGRHVMFAQVV